MTRINHKFRFYTLDSFQMKPILKSSLAAACAFLAFTISGCNSESDPINAQPNLALVEDDFQVAQAFEDLDNLTLTVLDKSGLGARMSEDIPLTEICPSAKIILDKTAKNIVVDFGNGCTGSNGITRKGKIMLSYTGNLLFPGSKVTTTFESYFVNGKKIEGIRTVTNTGINLATGTISLTVKLENGKITWPDNTFVTVVSDQIRAVKLGTAGYEASILGTANGKSRTGVDYTSTVRDALIIKQSCVESGVWAPSSGILQFTYSGNTVSVDYGSGICDKVVTISYPGGSKDVTLD